MNTTTTGYNSSIVRNNRAFTVIFVILQILFVFMYGFFIRPQANTGSNNLGLTEATGIAILVLIGMIFV